MSSFLEIEWRAADFCQPEDGLDYIFGRMGAIYGASFTRHWDGVDVNLVRQTWLELLGKYATYRPSMDYALKHMNPDYPPSALAFAKLCNSGYRIPVKPSETLTRTLTQAEIEAGQAAKEEALKKMREMVARFKGKKS